MKHIFLAILIISIGLISCKDYQARRTESFKKIEIVKKNVILFRLHSSENKIKYLEKKKDKVAVKKELNKVKAINDEIYLAFKNHFDFCDVYFFYPSEASNLKSGNYDEVALMDEDAKVVMDKEFLKNGYLVSTFGFAYGDEIIHETNSDRSRLGGTGGYPALVVMDQDYIQLGNPFPYRVLLNKTPDKRKDAIRNLNTSLRDYYYKYESKKAKMNYKKQRAKF